MPDQQIEQRMIRHIAQRDGVSFEDAAEIFESLSIPDRIRLEMEARPTAPTFESEYDPYGR